jgi:type VI secretion system Hcp family effector
VNPEALAYMHVKSSVQSAFLDDASRAGASKTLCLAVYFRGEVPHDVRKGSSYAVTQHQPISVIREWSASTVQFLISMWNNEVLDEVGFDFVRPDGEGNEEVYATLTLTKATVAFVEIRSGNTHPLMESAPRTVDYIGFHAEIIEFTVKGPNGASSATYERKSSAS